MFNLINIKSLRPLYRYNISLGVHEYLTAQNVPHTWHIDAGAHTFPVWKNDLYYFAGMIFK